MSRQRWTIRAFSAVGLLMASTALIHPPAASAQSAARPAAVPVAERAGQSPEGAALASAARTGVPVRVAGSQTETSRAMATPDGKLVMESYPVPRWVATPEGGWQQIDRRLRLENGVLAPVATLTPTRFSAGGGEPVATMPVAGGTVSFAWPEPLPAPRLEGDTAVYPAVLDGVDLRVTAQVDGFSWTLVVGSREAAANPALDSLRFRVKATGLSVASKPAGGFAVRDGAGTEVLSAGSAAMWDAAGTTGAARAALSRGSDPAGVLGSAPDRAHRAELPTRIDGSDLLIVPDAKVLRGPGTVYPVVIDPWTTINKLRWGYTNATNANRNDGVARVGNDPDGSGVGRAFFAFNLQWLGGRQIRSAKFLAKMTHSYSCASTPVNLWRSADLTTAGRQTWDGPNLQKWLQELNGHAHKPSTGAGCSDDPQPNLPMEFAAGALRTDIDAAKGTTNYTLALAARQSDGSSESTTSWWKKFDPAASVLSIEYNTPPNTPTAAQMIQTADYTAPEQLCKTGTARPILRSKAPWLKATMTDPDGSKGGLLTALFTLQKWNGTAWATVSGWPKTKTKVVPSGKAEIQVTGLASSDRLRWQVKPGDTLGGTNDASGFCEFDVDTTGPTVVPTVVSADGMYPEATPESSVQGNMGRSGRFTLGPNQQTDIASYTYQLNAGAVMTKATATPGGSVTVWVTPDRLGDNVLTVRARDKAGNPSDPYDYTFLVDEGSLPSAFWDFDEGSGGTLRQPSGTGPELHLADGPTWTDDRIVGTHTQTGRARAVGFNGSSESADSAAGIVDTSTSFAVATWVKINHLDATYQTILSQEGSSTSSFFLQASPDTVGKWRFARTFADATGTGYSAAMSTSAPRVGLWTHVAATYDAGTQQLRLYINGVLEGSAAFNPDQAWNATGPMHVARAKNEGVPYSFAWATVGEVRVWDRAIVDPRLDLRPLTEPVPVAEWQMEDLDDEAPRLAGDGSGYNRPLTLVDTPSATDPTLPATRWVEGRNFTTCLLMDGVTGSAATAGQVVRTNQSFSVSAWVRRDGGVASRGVWGQDGTVVSSAYLRHQDNIAGGAWVFALRTKDDITGTQVAALSTGTTSAWTHLVATYDAAAGVMSLYVNGALKATTEYRATWDSSGPFSVGRMKGEGVYSQFWNGAIDGVRVWQGALTLDDVVALYNEP
jgi:hypothetical protein